MSHAGVARDFSPARKLIIIPRRGNYHAVRILTGRVMIYNPGMTRAQIVKEVKYWTRKAADLTDVYYARLNGTASASMSAGGGSKSYTNWSNADFDRAIAKAKANAAGWKAKLTGRSPLMPRTVAVIRPGRCC